MSGETGFRPDRAAWITGVLAVALVGLQLVLLFGQVVPATLILLAPKGAAWVAVAVAVGAGLGVRHFQLVAFQRWLAHAFRALGAVSVLLVVSPAVNVVLPALVAMGLALGYLVTTLLAGLRASIGVRRLGVLIGLGLLFAEIIGQAPRLAAMSQDHQVVLCALLAGVGSLTAPFLTPYEPSVSTRPEYQPRQIALAAGLALMGALLVTWLAVADAGVGEGNPRSQAALVAMAAGGAALVTGFVLDRTRWVPVALVWIGLAVATAVIPSVRGLEFVREAVLAGAWTCLGYVAVRSGRVRVAAVLVAMTAAGVLLGALVR